VKKLMGVARHNHLSSLSASNSPVHSARRNLAKCFDNNTDSCPISDAETVNDDDRINAKFSPNRQHKGKRVRVSKGITKTATFFSMLKNRYRNGKASTIATGLGDMVMDKDANLVPPTDNDSFTSSSRSRKRGSCRTREAGVVSGVGGRKVSGCGLLRSNSQRRAINLGSGSTGGGNQVSPRMEGERSQRVLSGSLEGLLTAVNAHLSGEWSREENFDSEGEERVVPALQTVKSARSPSLMALTSFDTVDVDGDGDVEATDGDSASLSSSFSSPALKSLMDNSQNDSSPYGGFDSTSSTVTLQEPGVDDSLLSAGEVKEGMEQEKKNSKSNGGESLSRSPSSSSMDSAGELYCF